MWTGRATVRWIGIGLRHAKCNPGGQDQDNRRKREKTRRITVSPPANAFRLGSRGESCQSHGFLLASQKLLGALGAGGENRAEGRGEAIDGVLTIPYTANREPTVTYEISCPALALESRALGW